ncbi:MAG: ferritin-like domain-containing protein, partial [Chloroflexia bacterium]|nr:ferritin-like domain-containing protein [Chloroflexia bacterium]
MQPISERFLAAIEGECGRLRSRRGLLAGGARVAGGALALGVGGAAVGSGLRTALAQDFADDLEILNYALTLEHLEYAFYRDGLDELGEDAFGDFEGAADLFARLEEIRDHEGAHVDALTQTITDLGGEPVAEAEYDFGYDDVAGFLEVAMALENTGVAAYAGAAPSIEDAAVLAAALGIHSVEARHAAYLNERNEVSPFPDAVDAPQTRDEVLEAAGGFIAGEGAATPEGSGDAGG